jgi:hypothetical protein
VFAVSEKAVSHNDGTDDGNPDGGGGAVANELATPEGCLHHWFQRNRRHRFRHFEDYSARHVAGDAVAKIRRIEIESEIRCFVMEAMVLDLVGTNFRDERDAREQAVDSVVLDVAEPVRELEREIVEDGTEQKNDERLRFDDED